MAENFQQYFLLGEVFYSKDRRTSILELYTGEVYVVEFFSDIPKLFDGHIVQFVLTKGIPKQITILAFSGSAKAQLYKIAAEKKLMPFFSLAIQDEVKQVLDNTGINDPELDDMETLAFCTIDGEDTLDLDQALQVEKIETGFVVRYAIADAAYYIRPGSALFEEALKRGTSYYLPGLMIPMLPRELCVDVISLNENVSRRAVIFETILDQNGCHTKTTIIRARIRSRGKLSFKEVEDFLSEPLKLIRNDERLSESLRYFKEVGLLRLRLAEERNIARFHRTEVNVKLGQGGFVFNLLDNVRNEVELYNEQFSLLCNIAGARLLVERSDIFTKFIQPIYKIHPPPSDKKIKEFENVISQLIKVHKLKTELWHWRQTGDQTLSDYLKKLPQKGADSRISQAIHRQALLINTRSSFSEQPGRHYGVGADVYARFSAPMREIVGVFLHKELIEKIMGCDLNCSEEQDEVLRQQIIQAANRAKGIQRQLTNEANLLVLDQVFSIDFEKEEIFLRKGTVIGLGRDKLYILLDDISIEIKLYVQPLAAFWKIPLEIDIGQLSLINSDNQQCLVSLGDEVDIFVSDKDQKKHRWIFSIDQPVKRH
ncbi:MAG: RNB domain-containing ribonuclease [Methylococcaceae bacterium]|nr:RNB domain-containing ribonuclease [Methylococcaceae bacterium]